MAIGDVIDDLGSFSNPFGAPSKGQWNLSRGIYTTKITNQSIVFFFESRKEEDPSQKTALDQITDSGGRRLAVYEYPYRDGQAIADLGRKGETYVFNIKFHGPNYQQKFQNFLQVVVNSNEQGTIVHPVRSSSQTSGAITVRFRDYEFIHKYDEWNSITIRATFVEDSTDEFLQTNDPQSSQDSALRSALQTITNVQATISQGIFAVGALLKLPGAILAAMKQRLDSIIGDVSRLLGQLGVTFSSDQTLHKLSAQSQGVSGGVTNLSAGTTSDGNLPPVYQVGFDPTTQAAINTQVDNFINANQITPQQAVFAANQARTGINAAIAELNLYFGNDAYDLILQYTSMAISIQEAVESSIAATQRLVKVYVLPNAMSLRQVAKANGLDPDRQNDIESLNPYIASVNYLPQGTQITVPAS